MTDSLDEAQWVTCTREELEAVRKLADQRKKPTSRARGQKIFGYREAMGGDNRWHARRSRSPMEHG
jgi:hypothetical protein